MIDLEKEREAFELWQYSMASNIASINGFYVNERTSSEWFSWKKRAEIDKLAKTESDALQDEITKLKNNLERYESQHYILVPRELGGDVIEDMWDTFDKRPDMQLIHEAMIKAVEKG